MARFDGIVYYQLAHGQFPLLKAHDEEAIHAVKGRPLTRHITDHELVHQVRLLHRYTDSTGTRGLSAYFLLLLFERSLHRDGRVSVSRV